jgi:hypothetical protein
MIGEIVAAFSLGLLAAVVYDKFAGCSNGHVWDDGTPRWRIVPYRSNTKYGITRKDVYRCQCEGCMGEKTDETTIATVPKDEVEDVINEWKRESIQ